MSCCDFTEPGNCDSRSCLTFLTSDQSALALLNLRRNREAEHSTGSPPLHLHLAFFSSVLDRNLSCPAVFCSSLSSRPCSTILVERTMSPTKSVKILVSLRSFCILITKNFAQLIWLFSPAQSYIYTLLTHYVQPALYSELLGLLLPPYLL